MEPLSDLQMMYVSSAACFCVSCVLAGVRHNLHTFANWRPRPDWESFRWFDWGAAANWSGVAPGASRLRLEGYQTYPPRLVHLAACPGGCPFTAAWLTADRLKGGDAINVRYIMGVKKTTHAICKYLVAYSFFYASSVRLLPHVFIFF